MGGEECSTLCVCLYERKMPAGVHDADVNVGRCVAGLCKVDWHQRETGARRCKSRATLTDLAGKMGDKEARLYTQPLFGSPPSFLFRKHSYLSYGVHLKRVADYVRQDGTRLGQK